MLTVCLWALLATNELSDIRHYSPSQSHNLQDHLIEMSKIPNSPLHSVPCQLQGQKKSLNMLAMVLKQKFEIFIQNFIFEFSFSFQLISLSSRSTKMKSAIRLEKGDFEPKNCR